MAVWILAPLAGNRCSGKVRYLVLACLLYVGLATCQPAFCAAQEMPRASLVDLPLEWQDDHGAALQFSQWRGKTILLTMAYSTCREVCSFALHRLDELQESADKAHRPIEVIVISYDPTVDSPRSWSAYRTHHHLLRRNWHFLTGDAATTKQFATAFDFPSWRYDEHIMHDFKILMVGPGGQIAETLNWAARNRDPFAADPSTCSITDVKGCP